jgi:hypothetical protein
MFSLSASPDGNPVRIRPAAKLAMEPPGHLKKTSIIGPALISSKLTPPNAKAAWVLSKSKIRIQDNAIQTIVSTSQ